MIWNLQKVLYRCIHLILKRVVKHFNIPVPDLVSGPGSIQQLPALIKKEGLRNPLLVTDKGITSLGLTDSLLHGLMNRVQCEKVVRQLLPIGTP